MPGYRLKWPFRHFHLQSLTLFPKPTGGLSRGSCRRATSHAAGCGIMIGMECRDALQLHKPNGGASALSHRRLSLAEEAPAEPFFPVRPRTPSSTFYFRARVCAESLPQRWRLYYIKSSEWTEFRRTGAVSRIESCNQHKIFSFIFRSSEDRKDH